MATTAIKERPILFSATMVRAILDGRKAQTRRIIKPQPYVERGFTMWQHSTHHGCGCVSPPCDCWFDHCPHGKPGDRLWVRETWAAWTTPSHEYPGDCDQIECAPSEMQDLHGTTRHDCVYFADGPNYSKWRPSIHMPRWASRITLEITDVRVQRLKEISEEDCVAEGITMAPHLIGISSAGEPIESSTCHWSPSDYYAELWESINGAGSWDANPFVWAITFKKLQQEPAP